MTYLQFHFVFILPVIFLLALVYRRTVAAAMKSYSLKWMFAVAGIALIYTTAWDNYLVYRGVWGYGPERVMATIGYVPIEEYMFFLLQPLLTGLFFYILVLRRQESFTAGPSNMPRIVGALIYLLLAIAGIFHFAHDSGLYMGLILVWALPVLAGQWAYAGNWIWAERKLWFWSTIIPTIYLWIADRVALELGIWYIAEEYTTGWHLFGLPIEEATFFLVTNLLVTQGLFLFLHIGDPARKSAEPVAQV